MTGVRKLMLSGVALTGLLAIVAVASRAHRPGGGSGAGAAHPPRLLLEYGASVMIVLMPIGALLIFWALAQSRRQKVLSGQASWARSMVMVIVMVPLFIASFFLIRHFRAPGGIPKSILPPAPPSKKAPPANRNPKASLKPAPEAHFQWLPVLVLGSLVVAVVGTAAGSLAMRRRHGDAWSEEAAMLEALDEVLSDTLDDLRAERDPRRAVIRTWARMERTFAAYGVPRAEAEAPQEYISRVLDRRGVSVSALRKLTQLYARAKFSPHAVDSGMKDEAIEALAGLRAELEHREGEKAA